MTLDTILRKPQKELKRALFAELTRFGYAPITHKGFLYAEGKLPVLLVAHLDTVHKNRVTTICYSKDGQFLMSPQGIGGDDRAGVYMILQLLKTHKCHVLFCEDEECGGVGARRFTHKAIHPNVNYIVEVDRRGSEDAVFYDCDNPDFTRFVCRFGFKKEFGTFSDISVIAPYLGIAAVNISAGYYNEHTLHEYINLADVNRNIARLRRMLSAKSGRFEYIESVCSFGMCRLSPLRDGDYLISGDGTMLEPLGDMWMDEFGIAHELMDDYQTAIRLDNCRVYSKENMPAHFDDNSAAYFDVLPEEYL